MKFILIFASSNLLKDLDDRIELIRQYGFRILCQMYLGEGIAYYEKIFIEIESMDKLVLLAEILKADIKLDYKKHDDYVCHTLIVEDN